MPSQVVRATVLRLDSSGLIAVACPGGELNCEILESPSGTALAPGDSVMVTLPDGVEGLGVVLGRVSRYRGPQAPEHLVVGAGKSLTLQCGQSSIDLRADGKVMIRGEDVLVRAKGTKRIRAGSVSIN